LRLNSDAIPKHIYLRLLYIQIQKLIVCTPKDCLDSMTKFRNETLNWGLTQSRDVMSIIDQMTHGPHYMHQIRYHPYSDHSDQKNGSFAPPLFSQWKRARSG